MILLRWCTACTLALVLTFAALAANNPERRVALAIGNGAYQHVPSLPNPANDARAISAKLAEIGFEITEAIDLDLHATREAIERFGRDSAGADVALIFYAGHGLQVAGENYLLPVDAKVARATDLAAVSVRDSELHSAFLAAKPDLAVLILDACRDNPFVDFVAGSQGLASGSVAGDGLEQVRNSAGVLIAFSASPGAVAADGVDGNSPFTTALLQWIDRPGLEIGLMFRRVRQTVLELTDGAQIPWVEESLVSDVYLNPGAPEAETEATRLARLDSLLLSSIERFDNIVERRAAFAFYDRLLPDSDLPEDVRLRRASLDGGAGNEDSDFLQQSLIWLSIRESTDPAIFQKFLDHFPDNAFADLVRLRMARLESGATPIEAAEAGAAPVELAVPDAHAPLVLDPADAVADPADAQGADNSPEGTAPPAVEPPEAVILEAPTTPADTEAALALSGAQRIAVQRMLSALGDYSGALDGDLGPMSRSALGAFQTAAGLPGTGFLDPATLERLVARAASPVLMGATAPADRTAIHEVAAIVTEGAGASPSVIRVASLDFNPNVKTYWRTIADRFEAEHPGIRVELGFQPGNDYKRNLLLMLGSETPPDIFYTWGGGHLRALADAGFPRDLTAELAEGWAMSFKPGALSNVTIDGHVYAIPMRMTLVSLWANRAQLQTAGIDPASLASWDGFLAAVRALRQAGLTPLAVGGADGWPLQFYWGSLAEALGGPDALEQAVAGADPGFEAPTFVEAAEYLRALADLEPFSSDYLDMTNNDAIDAVAAGRAAMLLTGDWALPQLSRNKPGGPSRAADQIVRVPFPPADLGGGQHLTYGGTDGWVVRDQASEGTVAFLRMLSSLEVQTAMAAMGYAIPAIAGADTAIEDPILRDVAFEITNSRHHQLFLDQMLGPQAGEVVNDVSVALAEGDLTPMRAAAEVERAWEKIRSNSTYLSIPGAGEPRLDAVVPVE